MNDSSGSKLSPCWGKLDILEKRFSYRDLLDMYELNMFNILFVRYETRLIETPIKKRIIKGHLEEITYEYYPFIGDTKSKKSLGICSLTIPLNISLYREKKWKIKKKEQVLDDYLEIMYKSGMEIMPRNKKEKNEMYLRRKLLEYQTYEGMCPRSINKLEQNNFKLEYADVFKGQLGKKLYVHIIRDTLQSLLVIEKTKFIGNCNEIHLHGIISNSPFSQNPRYYPQDLYINYCCGVKANMDDKKKKSL